MQRISLEKFKENAKYLLRNKYTSNSEVARPYFLHVDIVQLVCYIFTFSSDFSCDNTINKFCNVFSDAF